MKAFGACSASFKSSNQTNMKYFLLLTLFSLFLNIEPIYTQEAATEDPYIWLEEIESEKSLNWVKAQNAASEKVLTSNALFDDLRKKLLKTFNDKDKIAYPNVAGDLVYNLWQDEKNERGLWRSMAKEDYLKNKTDWKTVIDIDELSKKEGKKWVYGGSNFLKPDNEVCLVSLSDGGKDENEIREFNLKTGEFVKEGFFFPESKGGVAWIDQNKVLVARNFGEGTLTTSGYPSQVKLLNRGASIDEAPLIFKTELTHLGAFPFSFMYEGKQHVFIYDAISTFESNMHYLNKGKLQKLIIPKDAELADFHKGEIIVSLQSDLTVNGSIYKKGSLVSMNLKENLNGNQKIKTIFEPDERSSFVSASSSKDFIIVNVLENVQNKLIKFSFNNDQWTSEDVKTPEFGSIYVTGSSNQSNEYFFIYSNFIKPTTLYHVTESKMEPIKKLKDAFEAQDLVIKQYHALSKDQTKIPYFIVHHKELKFNGKNPTMITAYGGFNVSRQPNYNSTVGLGWLEQGGVYVLANIRGGGEFGPSWHQAAMKEKRQNAYDDFYAVSEDVIAKNITSPEYLGAFGWSNGGLLAGVVFTQRPDLYNAVVVGAPLLDMKRYSKLLAGASWMGEYGDPDIPEDWAYLQKYSPYHNVKKGQKYPEVFFVTSTKDDRVHPGHARKMAAKMNDMGHPYIYHETIEGGHGASSTNDQRAYMWSGIYTYFNMKLNHEPMDKK